VQIALVDITVLIQRQQTQLIYVLLVISVFQELLNGVTTQNVLLVMSVLKALSNQFLVGLDSIKILLDRLFVLPVHLVCIVQKQLFSLKFVQLVVTVLHLLNITISIYVRMELTVISQGCHLPHNAPIAQLVTTAHRRG